MDVIDRLVGIAPGSRLDLIRARHPVARDNAQASYAALFAGGDAAAMTPAERHAVALFVALLHRAEAVAAFYRDGLEALEGGAALTGAVAREVAAGLVEGPYGHFPAGPLSAEDVEGLIFAVAPAGAAVLGARLAAALEHAHFLVFRPRDANSKALQALLDAGWSTSGIVTLSQLVSFLAFQIRVVAGLRVLAAA